MERKKKRPRNIYIANDDGKNSSLGKPIAAYTKSEARAEFKRRNGLSRKERVPVGVSLLLMGVESKAK